MTTGEVRVLSTLLHLAAVTATPPRNIRTLRALYRVLQPLLTLSHMLDVPELIATLQHHNTGTSTCSNMIVCGGGGEGGIQTRHQCAWQKS